MILLDLEFQLIDLRSRIDELGIPFSSSSLLTFNPSYLFFDFTSNNQKSIFRLLIANETNITWTHLYTSKPLYEVYKYCTYNSNIYYPDENGANILNLTSIDLDYLNALNQEEIYSDDIEIITRGYPNTPITQGYGSTDLYPDSDFLRAYHDWTYQPSTQLGKIIKYAKAVRRAELLKSLTVTLS